ncbi:MAG: hypothetical protein MJZ81_07660 [Bacteroidales bacterium]|nr:hypothetical protein [Bacteroidales bacterium]
MKTQIAVGTRVIVPNGKIPSKVVRMFEEDGRIYCKLDNCIGAWEVSTLTKYTRKVVQK